MLRILPLTNYTELVVFRLWNTMEFKKSTDNIYYISIEQTYM